MRYYELIYIINSNVERKKVDQVMKDIGERLKKAGSKLNKAETLNINILSEASFFDLIDSLN